MNPRLLGFLLASSALFLSSAASAQQISNVEVGAASTSLFGSRYSSTNDTGLVGRFTYNFTPSLSIDSEFGGFLTNQNGLSTYRFGGRPFLALVGPKASIRVRRVNLFFQARGGVLSYPTTFASLLSTSPPFVRKTYAALDVGGGAEISTSARTFLRFDFGRLMIPGGGASTLVGPSGGVTLIAVSSAFVNSPYHLEVGVGYRLGALRTPERSSSPPHSASAAPRFTAGALYSLMTLARGLQSNASTPTLPNPTPTPATNLSFIRSESAAGAFFTWDFSKYVGLDSSVLFFPRNMMFNTQQDGGRMLEALGGIRVGARRGRLGVYGKARLGTLTFTATQQSVTGTIANPQFNFSPFTNMATDLGGIVEYYASPRLTFRFDAGLTSIFYRERTVPQLGVPFQFPAVSLSAMQMTVGIGYRFGSRGTNSRR